MYIGAGNMLDQVKKHAFYGKEYNDITKRETVSASFGVQSILDLDIVIILSYCRFKPGPKCVWNGNSSISEENLEFDNSANGSISNILVVIRPFSTWIYPCLVANSSLRPVVSAPKITINCKLG